MLAICWLNKAADFHKHRKIANGKVLEVDEASRKTALVSCPVWKSKGGQATGASLDALSDTNAEPPAAAGGGVGGGLPAAGPQHRPRHLLHQEEEEQELQLQRKPQGPHPDHHPRFVDVHPQQVPAVHQRRGHLPGGRQRQLPRGDTHERALRECHFFFHSLCSASSVAQTNQGPSSTKRTLHATASLRWLSRVMFGNIQFERGIRTN
ncbi:hypothetical protein CEXT_635901 [Caerostris extrusa]|uniref:Uncharacterized protein n=1 Tax=Caerostris extrusa TaxID=172846 RepID=A0AAV4PHV5_CAEEX|nr:hypothetical protein CEXT_635901 [Caerostris extrusa]